MKKQVLALFLASALPALAAAETSTWNIDPAHTEAGFSVKHLVISTVRGQFGKTAGAVQLDEGDVTRSKINATIDASSIDTRVEGRDKDLKSENFLDVARYPTITFASTRIEKAGEDKLKVTGDLTLHGTTKPVTLDVTYTPKPISGMRQELRRGFTATTRINRHDFGLNYSKAVEAGPVVGDEIAIEINGEVIKASPQGKT